MGPKFFLKPTVFQLAVLDFATLIGRPVQQALLTSQICLRTMLRSMVGSVCYLLHN